MTDGAKGRIDQFEEDLRHLSSIQIVRKHIIFGECCILSQHQYFKLRSEVADHFGLHPNEVLVVGSAKLGFSVVPKKRYRPFCDESDIDVVLVSSRYFDQIWEDVFTYKREGSHWPEFREFVRYLFDGWIRPDKLPRSDMFPFGRKWWEFFQEVTRRGTYGDFKVGGALYKSYFFLEEYQNYCVQQCIDTKCISNLEGLDAGIS